MTSPITFDDGFYRLPSSERYTQVVTLIKKGQPVWTLADAEGCLIIDLGSDKVLPIWPTETLATDWGKKNMKALKV